MGTLKATPTGGTTPRTAAYFDTDEQFWHDWWRNWMLYGTVYAINNPEPRVVPAETLTVHEGPCAALAAPPAALDVERLARALTANWTLIRKKKWEAGGTPLEMARAIAAAYQQEPLP